MTLLRIFCSLGVVVTLVAIRCKEKDLFSIFSPCFVFSSKFDVTIRTSFRLVLYHFPALDYIREEKYNI